MSNSIFLGDCLDIMKSISDKSIDMILCDLPYGSTSCAWDTIIPLEPLWDTYKRIIKDKGCIVLTASQPFTSALVMSNPKMFKYEWIWNKKVGKNFIFCNYQPLKIHENILVFGNFPITENKNKIKNYNPVFTKKNSYIAKSGKQKFSIYGDFDSSNNITVSDGNRYPKSILDFTHDTNKIHSAQKPIKLFEYLIKTYTEEGQTVLDNCAGSGTTGIACLNTNRNFILIEKDEEIFNLMKKRIEEHIPTNDKKIKKLF